MNRKSDFWSRRKAQVEAEAAEEVRAVEAATLAAREGELAEKSDEELCKELGLPDPDTLQIGDDFRAFMSKAVPDRLRRRALRRLWVSNPLLANIDGMVDYGGDFTDKATLIENMQTAYQVGKGMTAHVEEMARQAEAKANPPADEEPEAMAELEPELDAPDSAPTLAEEASEAEKAPEALPDAEDEAEYVTPPRRRMRFQFDDHAGLSA